MGVKYCHPGRHELALIEKHYKIIQFMSKILLFYKHAVQSKKNDICAV